MLEDTAAAAASAALTGAQRLILPPQAAAAQQAQQYPAPVVDQIVSSMMTAVMSGGYGVGGSQGEQANALQAVQVGTTQSLEDQSKCYAVP